MGRVSLSMIVGNFNGHRALRGPFKTDPILLIDSKAVLSASIASQSLQPIALVPGQVPQIHRQIQPFELLARYLPEHAGARPTGIGTVPPMVHIGCPLVSKRPDHEDTIA